MNSVISLHDFQRQLLRCFQNNIPDRIMLALSGGVDSMCLAHLLAQYKKEVNPRLQVLAVTIDHGYRAESSAEARKVGNIVSRWGLEHHVEKLSYDRDVKSITNFEEIARELRYRVFRKICTDREIGSLLVAHNRDDQLETFLQRLEMNSTVFGLLGLRAMAPFPSANLSPQEKQISVYRPLLGYKKTEIRRTCETQAVPWFEDSSNQDVFLTKRNLLRFMINDYVPRLTNRPELECLSLKSLKTTIESVEGLVSSYENQVVQFDLASRRLLEYDEKELEMTLVISRQELKIIEIPVFARWLFKAIYPLSSAKHYYWTYAKLERHAMPRVAAWLKTPTVPLNMTYLNVSFNMELFGENVKLRMFRQKPQRKITSEYRVNIHAGDSSWKLFDRLWWIKFEKLDRNVEIRYSIANDIIQLKRDFPFLGTNMVKTRSLEFVPMVIDCETGESLALPTLNLTREGIFVRWKTKEKLRM